MAPSPVTEDYYEILGLNQDATFDLIRKAYLRLSLIQHPDRNTGSNDAFQLLHRAYETLSSEATRRQYDSLYSSIKGSPPDTQRTQTSQSSGSTAATSGALSDAAQIAILRRGKEERAVRLRMRKGEFDTRTLGMHREIIQLEESIKTLDCILAADLAELARKDSWGRWLLSPLYKQREESIEEVERKDRGRQERRVEKDLKERKLESLRSRLRREESSLDAFKKECKAEDLHDDQKIRCIETRVSARIARERVARETAELEQRAKLQRQLREQRERRMQEAREFLREQQAEALAGAAAARWLEQERLRRPYSYSGLDHDKTHWSSSVCIHEGWWPKVQGRTACPQCSDLWTYLLQCPCCEIRACPKCQRRLRPKYRR